WTSAERLELARMVYPQAGAVPQIDAPPARRALPETPEAALAEIVRGWLESSGPVTAAEIAARFAVPVEPATAALLQLQTEGQVLPGRFRSSDADEWCNRRLLAR